MTNKMTQAQLQAERKQRDAVIAKMAQADIARVTSILPVSL